MLAVLKFALLKALGCVIHYVVYCTAYLASVACTGRPGQSPASVLQAACNCHTVAVAVASSKSHGSVKIRTSTCGVC